MLSILGLLTGLAGPLSSIAGKIADLLVAKQQARTSVELKEIDQEIDALNARRDVLVAEAGSRINAVARFCLTLGPILYVSKYFIYDKVIGSFFGCTKKIAGILDKCDTFRTDGLDTNMTAVLLAVLGFYFLYQRTK